MSYGMNPDTARHRLIAIGVIASIILLVWLAALSWLVFAIYQIAVSHSTW